MDLKIVKILKEMPLKDYSPDYKDAVIVVWTNPSRVIRNQLREMKTELFEKVSARSTLMTEFSKQKNDKSSKELKQIEEKIQAEADEYKVWLAEWNEHALGWYANIWSQGTPETRWTVEELKSIDQKDPNLLAWLFDRTLEMQDLKKG